MMTDAGTLGFTLASLALLVTPGPTNTLLFTSGAIVGFRSSLALLFSEVLGHTLSICTLIVVLGPVLASHPSLKLVLQSLCAGYLIISARRLWTRAAVSAGTAIGFEKIFITTLLNPKGFIFASTVIPGDPLAGLVTRLPWLVPLSMLIVCVGATWIFAGGATRKSTGSWFNSAHCCRAGAVALLAFAGVLCWSVVASALSLSGGAPR